MGWFDQFSGSFGPSLQSQFGGRVMSVTPLNQPTQSNAGLMQNLIGSVQSSSDAANAAGMDRYNNLLAAVKGTQQGIMGKGGAFPAAMKSLNGFGKSAASDIELNRQNALGSAEQNMVSRGLGNTTLRTNAAQGVNADAQRQKLLLGDQLAAGKADLLTKQAGMQFNLGNLMADSILSRQDQGPDLNAYMQMIQQLAASSAGAGTDTFGGSGLRAGWSR